MNHNRSVIGIVLILLFTGALAASGEPNSPGVSPYLFTPGDTIEITVSSHEGQDRTLMIQPDGRIQVPLAGEIVAAGLTATQLAERIEAGLRSQLVDPKVTVSLRMAHTAAPTRLSVSLLGAVRTPGSYELREKGTLAELIAAAGGPLPNADLSRVVIAGADRSATRTVDLGRQGQTGLAQTDQPLAAGDLVIVPTGTQPSVTIAGEVGKPGSYDLAEGMRLMDLISRAGGPSAKADFSRVRLTRQGSPRVLDLRPVAGGEQQAASESNPPLQSGDAILLPVSESFVTLLGAVSRPEAYPLREGEKLFDLLTRAGGPTAQADLEKAVLVRRDAQGQPAAQRLDLRPMVKKGDMRENLALQPGDVLLVPGKNPRGPSNFGALGALFGPLVGVLSLFR